MPTSTSSTLAIAVGDEAEGLLEQRALHPVHDEAVDLALHHDRRVACSAQERGGALDRRRVGPGRGHDLGGRDQIGRVDRVHRPGSARGPAAAR